MAKLIEVASRAMDLYYQDYADRKAFFNIRAFQFHAATKYSTLLNTLFQVWRKENKADTGFSNVEINAQWLVTQKVKDDGLKFDDEQKRWFVESDHNIFSFDFDSWGNGLNGVRPYGGNNCNLKKVSNQEIRFYDVIPITPDIYYFLEGKNRVYFLKKPTLPLSLYYIPEVVGSNDNCVLSDNIVAEVITETLKLMFGAKSGNVIQESDDGNRNAIIQQQVNPALTKVQQM